MFLPDDPHYREALVLASALVLSAPDHGRDDDPLFLNVDRAKAWRIVAPLASVLGRNRWFYVLDDLAGDAAADDVLLLTPHRAGGGGNHNALRLSRDLSAWADLAEAVDLDGEEMLAEARARVAASAPEIPAAAIIPASLLGDREDAAELRAAAARNAAPATETLVTEADCRRCERTLPASAFPARSDSDSLSSWCRDCHSAYKRARRAASGPRRGARLNGSRSAGNAAPGPRSPEAAESAAEARLAALRVAEERERKLADARKAAEARRAAEAEQRHLARLHRETLHKAEQEAADAVRTGADLREAEERRLAVLTAPGTPQWSAVSEKWTAATSFVFDPIARTTISRDEWDDLVACGAREESDLTAEPAAPLLAFPTL